MKKINTDSGYMVRPKINPNLKIRAMTDSEKALADDRSRYQKNGKTTLKGAAKLLGDVGKKIGKRIIGKE